MEMVTAGNCRWKRWKERTRPEKSLLCTLTISAFLIIGFILAFISLLFVPPVARRGELRSNVVEIVGTNKKICLSAACTKAAVDILEAMDGTVDPCQNFYEYACGGWLKKHSIPEDKSRYSVFSEAKDSLELVIKQILETPVLPNEFESTAYAKKMYHACMNEARIEELGSQPVLNLLKQYLTWPVLETNSSAIEELERTFDWVETVANLRRDGGTYLLTTLVWADSRNTSRQIIYIDQSGVGMPSAEYMMRGKEDKYVKAYLNFMKEVAVILGADPSAAARDLEEVLDFEIELARRKTPREQRRDATKQYNKMTIRELQEKTSTGLDWMKYFDIVVSKNITPPISLQETVIVQEPMFFNRLVDLIQSSKRRTVANYIGWRVVQSIVWDLDSRFRDVYNRYRNVLYGTSMEKARWRNCVSVVTSYWDMAVGQLYVKSEFAKGSREQAEEMIDDINTSFLDLLINETDWMDQPAKQTAKEKALAISRKIGYPDMIYNRTAMAEHFKGQVASEHDHFANVLANSKVMAQKTFQELRDPFDKDKWAATPAEVNAFYSIDYNCITFPAGILRPPFFDKDRPKYLNYGAIGMVIGHEITHGFDDQGRQKDKDGNLRDWWPETTVQKFKNQTKCMIDQYSEFHVPELNMTLNGINTQGENIADNGGLKQARRAYDRWRARNLGAGEEEPQLPGLLHLTNEQLFYLSYAHIWCGISRPDALLNDILSGVHSPDKYRVEGPIRNSVEFAQAYRCPVGSPMNPPPETKCRVW